MPFFEIKCHRDKIILKTKVKLKISKNINNPNKGKL
jgi:hypothetical protein